MSAMSRVTVSLPVELVERIDDLVDNRSQFFAEAARNELKRRRRLALRESLQHPHPDALLVAEEGFAEWEKSLPDEDAEGLVDESVGRDVRWVEGRGWTEGKR